MAGGVDEMERKDELTEERKAADGKPRKLTVVVSDVPTIVRDANGRATHVVVVGKARFKGDITLHLRGDVAAAYWSITPGMQLVVLAIEDDDRVYEAEHVDILASS
jgi:hypothetical protein